MQLEWPEVPIPIYEQERLESLATYRIEEFGKSLDYNRWANLARSIMNTQFGGITMVERDRQWFKASCNLQMHETPRSSAFCGYTILSDQMLVVEDAKLDTRFQGNPLVTGTPFVRFYAGMPLISPDGFAIGAVCAFGDTPRSPTPIQRAALMALRDRVMTEFELDLLEREEGSTAKKDLKQLGMRRIYMEMRRKKTVKAVEDALLALGLG